MKIARFAERHPYSFVAIIEVVVILVYLLAGTFAYFLKLSNLGLYGLANLGLTVIVVILTTVMVWWKAIGFRSPARKSDLLYFIVPFIPMLLNFIPGIQVASFRFLLEALVISLMVGFVEEVIFRGLMLNALQARGLWKAAIITALLFGLTHALNLLTGRSLAAQLAQICYAVAIGFAFAALVLYTGIIWPLILAHWLIDFTNYLGKPGFTYPAPWDVLITVTITIIFTAYGVFLLLKKNQAKAMQA